MSESHDDRRDEPDDNQDDPAESTEHDDGVPADDEIPADDEAPADRSTADRVDADPDRESDDRRPRPREPHPHSRAEPAESDGWLSSLVDALERLDRGPSDSSRGDRSMVQYDVSIETGLDVADSPPAESGETGGERPRTRRRRSDLTPTAAHHVTTRTTDGEVLVTADVGGTDPDAITVGFDDGTLVVAVADRELERVDVPWRDRSADATIKNGVLTVRVTPAQGSEGER